MPDMEPARHSLRSPGPRWTSAMIAIVVTVASAAFATTQLLFPAEIAAGDLGNDERIGFLLLDLLEAVALGIAVVVVAFGGWIVDALPSSMHGHARLVQMALAWAIGNWWLHDGLHRLAPGGTDSLLGIEFAFHVTVLVAGVAVANSLLQIARMGLGTSAQRRYGVRGREKAGLH